MTRRERILGGLWGALVGDALGVPVEFKPRTERKLDPVIDMREFGTHQQPKGSWSDDGALILCTVDSLLSAECDLADMGRRFVEWMDHGLWTASGEAFDVGCATSDALLRIANGCRAELAGSKDEFSNGNGSLMRILPAVLRFVEAPTEILVQRLEQVSAITHAHPRSKMACVFYGLVVRQLLRSSTPETSLQEARAEFVACYKEAESLGHFRRVLQDDLVSVAEDLVVSTGYVLHTLHASLWCLLNSASFSECVLKAVNLGGDTDTTGCVAGGLAGTTYGLAAIPAAWREALPRRAELDSLFERLCEKVG